MLIHTIQICIMNGGSMACCYVWFKRVLPAVLCSVFILTGCKPIAVIKVDSEFGFAPLLVKFDASMSRDIEKDITEYSWDFDNDGKFDALGIKADHTFNNPGVYTVKLRVTDSQNYVSDAIKTINVEEASIRAIITAGNLACVSFPVSFDASASIDVDNDIIDYSWEFGDGTTASGVTVNHTYNTVNTFTARLQVRDAMNQTSTTAQTIQIYGNPTVNISADNEIVPTGGKTVLRWNSTNATTVSINNGIGSMVINGSVEVSPSAATTYTITATGPCGTVNGSITIRIGTPITITLQSPQNGETINNTGVTVKGSINNPLGGETVVLVNDIPAFIYNNQFVVTNVPIKSGSNTITVKAQGIYGNTGQKTVTVHGNPLQKLVAISSDAITGISPVETYLTISAPLNYTYTLSYTNPSGGQVEFLAEADTNKRHIRLTGEGIYVFTVKMIDSQNNEHSDSVSIVVQSKQKIDTTLRQKWDEMKAAMTNKNVDGALKNFNDASKEEYREIFTSIINDLPALAIEMSNLEFVCIRGPVAKYRLKRNEEIEGQQYNLTYYVYYVQNPFGNWTIDGF
jgi:chitodextrinase